MFCTKCGSDLSETDVFCWNCGAKVISKEAPTKQLDSNDSFKIFDKHLNNVNLTESSQTIQSVENNMDKVENNMNEVENIDDDASNDYPVQQSSIIQNFYVIDFAKRIVGKENLPLFFYLILNVLLIGIIATFMFGLPIIWGIVVGFLLYLGSISIALSPIGEWMLRRQTGCEEITDQAIIDRLAPIFNEVYHQAKKANPLISSDVRLFMNSEKSPNAFATGRKTICVTEGLLSMDDEQIKGTLGHEFGHLSHKDTDRILVVQVGNTIITGICVLIQVMAIFCDISCKIFAAISGSDEGIFASMLASLSRFITVTLVSIFMKLWTMIGVALCMKTSRGNEYQADAFSVKLGYGKGLASMLNSLGGGAKPKGLFAALASSHPDTNDRIKRILEQMGEQ